MRRYRWDAEDYERHSNAQKEWAHELLAKLDLQSIEAVLDIGCGDGKVTAEIGRSVPLGRVVGIDNSEAMIESAKKTYPQTTFPNLTFQLMDARRLVFEEQFDVCFSNAALRFSISNISVP